MSKASRRRNKRLRDHRREVNKRLGEAKGRRRASKRDRVRARKDLECLT